MTRQIIHFTVNGKDYDLEVKDGSITLLNVLRNELDLTGAKRGWIAANVALAPILMDGDRSILSDVGSSGRRQKYLTIEGLEKENGRLDPLQESFWSIANSAVSAHRV